MKQFFINRLEENEIQEQKNRYGNSYTEGHKKEHAAQKHFNTEYRFDKDSRPFYTHSDIESERASVKSANCTLFVATVRHGNRHIIDINTSVETAINYYIDNDISIKYMIVLEPKKWCKNLNENQYVVIELDKQEMKKLLLEYACTDRDSKLKNGKNALRLKRTDDIIYKWYLMNR